MGDNFYARMQPLPTAPDPGRRAWARLVMLQAEHRRFESRKPISGDDVTNVKIVLGLANTVQEVIDNG